MIGRTNTGGGGGGAGLNFRLIGGTTAPNNPKEKDIWVNTDVEIPNWVFSSVDPRPETYVDCATGLETTYIASDGTETYYPASIVTEYVKLPDNTAKITTINSDLETANMYHAFYTADKTLISTVERKKDTTTYEVPEGAVYVRLTVYNSRDPQSFVATIGMENGFVWIETGTESDAAFPVDKKSYVYVYPVGAKQYISGEWKSIDGYIYQGGEWVQFALEWDGYYFKDGEQYEEITGGWTTDGWTNTGTATIGETLVVSGSSSGQTARISTRNPIDLTNVNTIWTDSPNGKNNTVYPGYLYICTELNEGTKVAEIVLNTVGTKSVDVSNLSGSYYLVVRTLSGEYKTAYGDVRAIWGE